MAIGKESMERAAKAAKKKEAAKAAEKKAAPAKKVQAKAVKAAQVLTPSEEVMGKIVYQKSAEVLERAAEPNELFSIGDAMPIYYL